MKLTILGSGTIFSGKERKTSSHLVEGKNSSILVDCGFSALKQLQKVFNPLKIHNFFLTHTHLDHSLDLPAFIAFRREALYWRQSVDKSQLNVFGPKGLREFYSNLARAFPQISEISFKVELKELENSELKLFGFRVKSKPVRHRVEALAYRVEEGGKSIAFSGDTGYCEGLVELAKDADLLVLECSFPSEMERDYHLTPRQCGIIAGRAKPKALLLTHFYPASEETDILEGVRESFKGEVLLAEDLMELRV